MIVDRHGCHTALHFGVKAKENQDKVPTLYWLPKLHKNPYKARFIANSSSCTTTELSKLLTSCLTAVKNMLLSIVKRYMRLQSSLSERVIVDGHGCHTGLHFGVKAKENQTMFLRCTG